MKNQFVADFSDGDVVNDYFIAVRRDLRDMQNGGKFLGLVFRDKSGEIGGIMWTNAASVAKLFEPGDVVNVRGSVSTYQERLQVRVDQVIPLRKEEYDLTDLVLVPEDVENFKDAYLAHLATIKDPFLKQMVEAFLKDESFMEGFLLSAAGKKWHHAHQGGLLRHCYEMSRIADTVCELFPDVNRDLVQAGIFVHDIGKLKELSQGLFVEYTTHGKLVGHLQIGCNMVSDVIREIDGFPEALRLQLIHLILSHHGELANGSPVVPKTLEAIVLHLIDNLDAQTDAFSRIISETRSRGELWSEYLPLIQRQIWTNQE